jgi:hypothetical protein
MKEFNLAYISDRFPTDDDCLEEIKRLRFPEGIICNKCNMNTKHYKIIKRKAYACSFCRNQMYPLKGTVFEKTTTPLRIWFYAMFLMTRTFGKISVVNLQRELGVTYKTAWRISKRLNSLMSQNNADLLKEKRDVFSLNIFNAIEFDVVQKKESNDEDQ